MFARENVSLFLDKIRFLKDFQRLLVLYYKIHQSKDSAPWFSFYDKNKQKSYLTSIDGVKYIEL